MSEPARAEIEFTVCLHDRLNVQRQTPSHNEWIFEVHKHNKCSFPFFLSKNEN